MKLFTNSQQLKLIRTILFVIFSAVLSIFTLLQPSFAASNGFEISHSHSYPDWFIDSPFLDLEEAKDQAISEDKKGLMILFTTQGCSYCAQFIKRSLGNPQIAKQVQNRFASIGLEIFDDTEMVSPAGVTMSVKQFALQEGVGFAPTLLFYNEEGRRVLRQVGYQAPDRFVHLMDYVANKSYDKQSLSEYLATKAADKKTSSAYTQLRTDKLFDTPPYALDRSYFDASEPLMVLFEKTGCRECEGFHNDVLKRKNVRDALQEFQVVRMDVNDSETPVILPNGKLTTPAKWYKQTSFSRLPAVMFFNESGALSLQTDAYILENRMMNLINYMREKAYLKDWTYQQFSRFKAIEKNLQQEKN